MLLDPQKDSRVTSAADLLLAPISKNGFTAPENPPLYDVQGYADTRGIPLLKAGIKDVEMPVTIAGVQGQTQVVALSATMSVSLLPEHKGTHMSRFILQLSQWSQARPLNIFMQDYLEETRTRLNADAAFMQAKFKYFMARPAPVSDLSAPMAYATELKASLDNDGYRLTLGVHVPIATVCPCSKAISKYGAHNQRVMLSVKLNMAPDASTVWLEDLIPQLETCSSCPVYPLLKRQDEKYVTEHGYENPKFVEDVARELTLLLRGYPGVSGFQLEVEALESIHAHNAWAFHEEHFVDR